MPGQQQWSQFCIYTNPNIPTGYMSEVNIYKVHLIIILLCSNKNLLQVNSRENMKNWMGTKTFKKFQMRIRRNFFMRIRTNKKRSIRIVGRLEQR